MLHNAMCVAYSQEAKPAHPSIFHLFVSTISLLRNVALSHSIRHSCRVLLLGEVHTALSSPLSEVLVLHLSVNNNGMR